MKHNTIKTALMTSALTILLLGNAGVPGSVPEIQNPSGKAPIEDRMPEGDGIAPLSDDGDVEKNSYIEE